MIPRPGDRVQKCRLIGLQAKLAKGRIPQPTANRRPEFVIARPVRRIRADGGEPHIIQPGTDSTVAALPAEYVHREFCRIAAELDYVDSALAGRLIKNTAS